MNAYEFLLKYLAERDQHDLIYMTLTAEQAKAESEAMRALIKGLIKAGNWGVDPTSTAIAGTTEEALSQAAKALGWKD